jgi:hypothetical protein
MIYVPNKILRNQAALTYFTVTKFVNAIFAVMEAEFLFLCPQELKLVCKLNDFNSTNKSTLSSYEITYENSEWRSLGTPLWKSEIS